MLNTTTYLRSEDARKPRKVTTGRKSCLRCGGTGIYYHHGVCYGCGGNGFHPTAVIKDWEFPATWSDDKCGTWLDAHAEKLRNNREAAAARKQAARLATLDVYLATIPDGAELYAWAQSEGNYIARDIAMRALTYGTLSDKQLAFLRQLWEEATTIKPAWHGPAAPVREGDSVTIDGTIVARKWVENRYGETCKLMIRTEQGTRWWGTEPAALEATEIGDRVRLIARVEASNDDPSFGFYKRPRKAALIEATEHGGEHQ